MAIDLELGIVGKLRQALIDTYPAEALTITVNDNPIDSWTIERAPGGDGGITIAIAYTAP